MTQEEKARAYNEVREKIALRFGSNVAEEIFSMFEESEDERIRKAIIEFFELQDDNTTYSFIPKKDILAWLEKQKSVTCNTIDSNNDEKIRKNCIHFLELQKSHHAGTFEIEECIAWLEKQGINYSLAEEIKKRKDSFMREKEKAVSSNDKLSLGARIAMLEELLVFVKEKHISVQCLQ